VRDEAAGLPPGCARLPAKGILTDLLRLKPLWDHASMVRPSRWLISERWRKKATMEARKYWARVGI
jgi:hypothetical protein